MIGHLSTVIFDFSAPAPQKWDGAQQNGSKTDLTVSMAFSGPLCYNQIV